MQHVLVKCNVQTLVVCKHKYYLLTSHNNSETWYRDGMIVGNHVTYVLIYVLITYISEMFLVGYWCENYIINSKMNKISSSTVTAQTQIFIL